jgi:hypothetical protein
MLLQSLENWELRMTDLFVLEILEAYKLRVFCNLKSIRYLHTLVECNYSLAAP